MDKDTDWSTLPILGSMGWNSPASGASLSTCLSLHGNTGSSQVSGNGSTSSDWRLAPSWDGIYSSRLQHFLEYTWSGMNTAPTCALLTLATICIWTSVLSATSHGTLWLVVHVRSSATSCSSPASRLCINPQSLSASCSTVQHSTRPLMMMKSVTSSTQAIITGSVRHVL